MATRTVRDIRDPEKSSIDTQNDREAAYPLITLQQSPRSEPVPQSLIHHALSGESQTHSTAFKLPTWPEIHDLHETTEGEAATESLGNERDIASTEYTAPHSSDGIDGDTDLDTDSETESEPEPSPSLTPLVSDLDVFLEEDSPIPIPSPLVDDEETETPEPAVSPFSRRRRRQSETEENNESIDEDPAHSDCDDFNFDLDADDSPTPRLTASGSLTERTMTRLEPQRHQKIKCFTPITQQMARRRIQSKFARRRSVQHVSPSMHFVFPLDSDLQQIRADFVERKRLHFPSDGDGDEKQKDFDRKIDAKIFGLSR